MVVDFLTHLGFFASVAWYMKTLRLVKFANLCKFYENFSMINDLVAWDFWYVIKLRFQVVWWSDYVIALFSWQKLAESLSILIDTQSIVGFLEVWNNKNRENDNITKTLSLELSKELVFVFDVYKILPTAFFRWII